MIYLDYNATTPIDKSVALAMEPYIYQNYGNPSSSHEMGIKAKNAVNHSRFQVAKLLNCTAEEIVFTGTGSESNNTIIKGVAKAYREAGNHIITSSIEHPAVLNCCRELEKSDIRITYLPVDSYGRVDPQELVTEICKETILVSIMHSNNETGTLQPIKDIANLCRKHELLFHTDASQSVGKIPLDIKDLGVDFLTIAGHKLYAPKGIGAFFKKQGVEIPPLIHGGGQEFGLRSGTENVIFIVALGKACEMAGETLKSDETKELTAYFYEQLIDRFGDKIQLNGDPVEKLPNTLNISFLGYTSEEILRRLEGVVVSAGSACHAGSTQISPVLKAMGISEMAGKGPIRFSLGKYTTKQEIDVVLGMLEQLF
ncbi:MAG: cysteine desulfurase [Proteobacteria bacterium]|nr:cysteine desulfurase [Pseudomonadota bacterium]